MNMGPEMELFLFNKNENVEITAKHMIKPDIIKFTRTTKVRLQEQASLMLCKK